MVQGKWFPQGSDLSVPLSLRTQIFNLSRDKLDDMAQQVVVYKDETPVGTARLWWAEGAFRLGDLGVLENWRGQGFGDLLIRLLLNKALNHHASLMQLACPEALVLFFARYGFTRMETHENTKPPQEVWMQLQSRDVSLSHCPGSCNGCEQA